MSVEDKTACYVKSWIFTSSKFHHKKNKYQNKVPHNSCKENVQKNYHLAPSFSHLVPLNLPLLTIAVIRVRSHRPLQKSQGESPCLKVLILCMINLEAHLIRFCHSQSKVKNQILVSPIRLMGWNSSTNTVLVIRINVYPVIKASQKFHMAQSK